MLNKLLGRNTRFTSTNAIKDQLLERRPLPTGMTEWDEWADRIIAGAMLTASPESQKFALANMILHLGPTESHKEDAFFIHTLLKTAANQIADAKRCEIRDAAKARLDAEAKLASEQAKPQSDVTPNVGGTDGILEVKASKAGV